MKSNSIRAIYLFLGIVIALFVAFLFDQWINWATIRAQNLFNTGNVIVFANLIGQFIIVGICMFLGWLVIYKSSPNVVLSILFIGIGLFLSFFNIIAIQFSALNAKVNSALYPFSSSNLHLLVASCIIWIGLINIFRYKTQSKERKS